MEIIIVLFVFCGVSCKKDTINQHNSDLTGNWKLTATRTYSVVANTNPPWQPVSPDKQAL